MIFGNRAEAGRLLAERISALALPAPVVVALPRGGVPVGFEIAAALGAPLDILVVRKIGVPWRRELALGAIGEDGLRVLNDSVVRRNGVTPAMLAQATVRAEQELAERRHRLRGVVPAVPLAGRTVVLTDDGIATGATARAAIAILRAQHVERLVLAVPVAAAESVEELRTEVDDLVCLQVPPLLSAIGSWYADFSQVQDDEVRRLLALSGTMRAG